MLVLSVHTPSINFLTNDRIYSIKLRALSHMLPLHAPGHGKCFNPRQLFPSDKQWARFDVRDECNTTHVARAFYASTNATCSKQTGAPPISFLCTFPLQYCSYSYCPSTVGLLQSNLMFHTMVLCFNVLCRLLHSTGRHVHRPIFQTPPLGNIFVSGFVKARRR